MFTTLKQDENPKLPFRLKFLYWTLILLIFWQVLSLLALPKAETRASDLTLDNIIAAVNKERTLRNLSPLNADSRLNAAAQYKSDDMQARHYFSHTDPEGNYIWGKIVEKGYTPYLQLGENLAVEFYSTESLVSAWMNSPTHRANVLNEGFKDQGMGMALGEPAQGQYYSAITNTFGTLLPAKKTERAPAPAKSAPAPASPAPAAAALEPATEPKIVKAAATNPPASDPVPVPKSEPAMPAPKTPLRPTPSEAPRSSTVEVAQTSQNFSLPPQNQTPATITPVDNGALVAMPRSQNALNAYKINRYLMLGLGLLLLFMLLSDIKKMLAEKFSHFDKKINNLVLLILSLLVIGVMYWL